MTKIIADSSTLLSINEGNEMGVAITPLTVTINKKTYREFEDIDAKTFIDIINEGHIPSSSQPPIGEVVELINQFPNDDILILSMTDGLSGTYGNAVSASQMVDNPERIKVLNTRTLCGPHRYVTEVACKMAKENKPLDEILYTVKKHLENSISFLLPQDFAYLKRGGRLTALSATLGGLLKLQPILILTDDGKKLDKFDVSRSFDIAINKVINKFKEIALTDDNIIYITHAFVEEQAHNIQAKLNKVFPNIETRIMPLSCAFITQGGPGCIAIQTVKR